MKLLRGSLAALASLTLLAACAPTTDTPAGPDDPSGGQTTGGQTTDGATDGGTGGDGAKDCDTPTTLRVWSWRTEDVDAYNKIFGKFTEKNPCIKVDFQAFVNTEYNQILQTGLTGSDGPDIAQLRSYGQLQPLIEGGNLVALDDIVPDAKNIDENILAGGKGREDGKVYGIPFASQTVQMFYNKKIFEEHGLEEPKTWDDFLKINQTLKDKGVTPMAVGGKDAWMMPIVHDIVGSARYGGSEFEEKVLKGEAKFTDPDYVASLQLVKDLQGFMPDSVAGISYSESQVLFTSELAAMFPGGSFELAFFQSENPELEMGVFQVPPPPDSVLDHAVTPAWADANFGISAATQNKEAAEELMRWLATPEFGQLVADELKQFSPIPGVKFQDPLMDEMWSLFNENPAPYLMLINFRYGDPSGTDLVGEGVQQMFLDQATAQQVGEKIDTGLAAWFKPTS